MTSAQIKLKLTNTFSATKRSENQVRRTGLPDNKFSNKKTKTNFGKYRNALQRETLVNCMPICSISLPF
jgi:hypothetical protein